jgi:hypothetical protein
MHRQSFILTLFIFITLTTFAQRRAWTGYRVYSAIINSEISDTAQSTTILGQLEIENQSSGLVEAIKSADKQMIYFYTKRLDIDSLTLKLIIDYYDNQTKESLVAEGFVLHVKTFVINKKALENIFKESVVKGWKRFNTKYPKSAGLFKFSKVYFSTDVTKAVFYYSHQKAGLNGHGDLVVMERINNLWEVKYLINLWQS